MKSILLKLYQGELFPSEQINVKTEEYQAMRRKHFKHYEDFSAQLKALNPPLDETFISIMDEQLDAVPLEVAGTFIEGFRLGARMIIEIYQGNYSDSEE